MIFVVGSESPIKIRAHKIAFEALDPEIRGVKVFSFVPEGPYGSETFEGARSRCIGARDQCRVHGAFYTAIENGIQQNLDGRVVDFPVFHIIFPNEKELMVTGPSVVVPGTIYREWEDRVSKERKLTWGDVYAERHGCDPKNPHSHLTGTPRVQLLVDTIRPIVPLVLQYLSVPDHQLSS